MTLSAGWWPDSSCWRTSVGSGDDVFGEAGESRDLDAVAFFGAAGEDLAEEDDLLVPLPSRSSFPRR